MVKVLAPSKTIECDRAACALQIRGAKLRQILLKFGVDLYNGGANVINCRDIGSCGICAVCAVLVEGKILPSKLAG